MDATANHRICFLFDFLWRHTPWYNSGIGIRGGGGGGGRRDGVSHHHGSCGGVVPSVRAKLQIFENSQEIPKLLFSDKKAEKKTFY